MKILATVIAATILAAPAHAGRFLHHKQHMTLRQKVSFFQRSLRHERQALAWLRSRQAPRTLQRRSELAWERAAIRWHTRLLAQYQAKLAPRTRSYSVAGAICSAFGPYCLQALAVARCESTLSVYAQNGQYLGLFQMGDYARSRYGHGMDALTQARAAYAYFRDSGSDWSPWQCKP